MDDSSLEARDTIERSVRSSYGRLLAFLSARSKDIAACEDALSEAFKKALEKWPKEGVPENPDAWILTAARNRLLDQAKHNTVVNSSISTLLMLDLERTDIQGRDALFRDERLKLLFVCAHPAIDSSVHTPLMLQVVLGINVADIASAFLASPSSIAKKLTRAKRKIRDTGIAFDVPGAEVLSGRLESVLEAIFAAYGQSWDHLTTPRNDLRALDSEAVYLAELLVTLLPNEPEPMGLLSLIYFCESRKHARRSIEGRYIPLDEQDVSLWNFELRNKAERLLEQAFTLSKVGRFQIEAAIQSAHDHRVSRGVDNRAELVKLYDGLIGFSPTLGALVGRAAAVAGSQGVEAGMILLDAIPKESVSQFQPFWALRASFMQKIGNVTEMLTAANRAVGLTEDPSVRDYLMQLYRTQG